MLAENLENLLRKARLEGFREGRLEGRQEVN
jgi:flagellar biosynthesis/type III secretory pathway protein FliH